MKICPVDPEDLAKYLAYKESSRISREMCGQAGHHSVEGPIAISGSTAGYICVKCGASYTRKLTSQEAKRFRAKSQNSGLAGIFGTS